MSKLLYNSTLTQSISHDLNRKIANLSLYVMYRYFLWHIFHNLQILDVFLFCCFVCIMYNGTFCPSTHPHRCSNGYFGQPSVPGSSCQPCQCHGNLDLSLPGSCDPTTGQCLHCRQGYGGVSCGICAEGYYGDAVIAKNCQRE